jgi:transketolase
MAAAPGTGLSNKSSSGVIRCSRSACEPAMLSNLVAIVDVNRLGQRGATEWGWDLDAYAARAAAFGARALVIDGHDWPPSTTPWPRSPTPATASPR